MENVWVSTMGSTVASVSTLAPSPIRPTSESLSSVEVCPARGPARNVLTKEPGTRSAFQDPSGFTAWVIEYELVPRLAFAGGGGLMETNVDLTVP